MKNGSLLMKIAKQRVRRASPERLDLIVDYQVPADGLPDSHLIHHWARAALQPGIDQAEIGVRIVDNAEGQALNRDYRGKDYPTNVLSFALNEGSEPVMGLPLFGDLVLTAPVLAHEAHEQGKPLFAHYAHLVVHGMLHLQGFDHVETAQAERMELLESAIMKKLGYPDPYGEETL